LIYSDSSLIDLKKQGYLPEGVHIGPSSVDLTLSSSFCCLKGDKNSEVDIRVEQKFYEWNSSSILMSPGEFLLASTYEQIGVPVDCAAYVEGRSSVGRIGIQVQNAGFIDAGFRGQITLELQNQSMFNVRLHSGMRICQLVYCQMTTPCSKPYDGKYQFQKGATFSRIHQDVEFYNNLL
jgi:dCTP deaminase